MDCVQQDHRQLRDLLPVLPVRRIGVAVLVVPWWAEGGARVVGGWLDGGEAANGLVDGRVGGRGDGEAGGVERARKAR